MTFLRWVNHPTSWAVTVVWFLLWVPVFAGTSSPSDSLAHRYLWYVIGYLALVVTVRAAWAVIGAIESRQRPANDGENRVSRESR